jgi:hypothetical protein
MNQSWYFFLFWDGVLLCSPGWPWTQDSPLCFHASVTNAWGWKQQFKKVGEVSAVSLIANGWGNDSSFVWCGDQTQALHRVCKCSATELHSQSGEMILDTKYKGKTIGPCNHLGLLTEKKENWGDTEGRERKGRESCLLCVRCLQREHCAVPISLKLPGGPVIISSLQCGKRGTQNRGSNLPKYSRQVWSFAVEGHG